MSSSHCQPCHHCSHVTITHIANVETSTAIWEFDPTDSSNRFLELSGCCRCSSYYCHQEYFKTLQQNSGIDKVLKIPLHSNIQWGTADGMLSRAYALRHHCRQTLWTNNNHLMQWKTHQEDTLVHVHFQECDWERVNDTQEIYCRH
ncbi:hypothetical protein BDR07DRAFT_1383649 [Suillus spraguei]|nr:hypothetical protein BDR07DRAFT_1383649 [Suillus spraguei]